MRKIYHPETIAEKIMKSLGSLRTANLALGLGVWEAINPSEQERIIQDVEWLKKNYKLLEDSPGGYYLGEYGLVELPGDSNDTQL